MFDFGSLLLDRQVFQALYRPACGLLHAGFFCAAGRD